MFFFFKYSGSQESQRFEFCVKSKTYDVLLVSPLFENIGTSQRFKHVKKGCVSKVSQYISLRLSIHDLVGFILCEFVRMLEIIINIHYVKMHKTICTSIVPSKHYFILFTIILTVESTILL